MKRNHLPVINTALLILLTAGSIIVLAKDSTTIFEIDMTIPANVVTYNEAFFHQGPVMNAGSGNLNPFLTVDKGGPITKGYNTEPASNCEFDTAKCKAGDTHNLLVSAVPELEIEGVAYREFVLDINMRTGKKGYLSRDELK